MGLLIGPGAERRGIGKKKKRLIAIEPNLAADRCAGGMGELVSRNPERNFADIKLLDMNSMVALIEITKERDFEFWHMNFLQQIK